MPGAAIPGASRLERGTHERGGQQLPDPGMSEPLSSRQYETLCWRVHRHVGWLLNDVEAFEMYPHGMGRIGQASVSKGIGREQIAEFIIPSRRGNSEDGNQRKAKRKGE